MANNRPSSPTLSHFLGRNEKFVASCDPDVLARCAEGQSPSVFWLGCSDSRVPEGLVIRAGLGEVFVHRNVANLFTPDDTSATAALAYAVNHLKVSHVVVVGHEKCGGCAAALSVAKTKPASSTDDIGEQAIGKWIEPIRAIAANHLEKTPDVELSTIVHSNVCAQVSNVVNHSVLKKAWARGQAVSVHGWVYDLATGKLNDLGVTNNGP